MYVAHFFAASPKHLRDCQLLHKNATCQFANNLLCNTELCDLCRANLEQVCNNYESSISNAKVFNE